MQRMRQTLNNRVTPKSNGKEGLSISGNADFGNGLGLGVENGRNGTTGSLTILGSQQGTVDQNGNYEANANFLAEINGQDIADLAKTIKERQEAEENERNPVKNAKDAKDAATQQPEEGPSGLVDVGAALFTGGLAALTAYGARLMAGGGSSSSSPTAPAGNTANAETPVVGRKPRDEDEKDGKVKGEGDAKDEPPKKQPTKEELANFKDNIFWNTTKAATDDYLKKLNDQGIDTKEMRAHAEALRAKGVRDLTQAEIQAKRLNKELNDLKIELDKVSTIAQDNGLQTEGMNPLQQQAQRREEIKQMIADKEKEVAAQKDVVAREANVVKPVKDGLDIGGVGAVMLAGIKVDNGDSPYEDGILVPVEGNRSTTQRISELFSNAWGSVKNAMSSLMGLLGLSPSLSSSAGWQDNSQRPGQIDLNKKAKAISDMEKDNTIKTIGLNQNVTINNQLTDQELNIYEGLKTRLEKGEKLNKSEETLYNKSKEKVEFPSKIVKMLNQLTDTVWFEVDGKGNIKVKIMEGVEETKPTSLALLKKAFIDRDSSIPFEITRLGINDARVTDHPSKIGALLEINPDIKLNTIVKYQKYIVENGVVKRTGTFETEVPIPPHIVLAHELVHVPQRLEQRYKTFSEMTMLSGVKTSIRSMATMDEIEKVHKSKNRKLTDTEVNEIGRRVLKLSEKENSPTLELLRNYYKKYSLNEFDSLRQAEIFNIKKQFKEEKIILYKQPDKTNPKSPVDWIPMYPGELATVFEGDEIEYTTLTGDKIKLNNKFEVDGKTYTFSENTIRNEHNLPYRMNYLKDRYPEWIQALDIVKADKEFIKNWPKEFLSKDKYGNWERKK